MARIHCRSVPDFFNSITPADTPTEFDSQAIGKKDPTQYLLTIEQTIENDCPIPSYLTNVFSKPDVETPEIDPDADTKLGNQSFCPIFCDMARAPSCVFSIVYRQRQNVVYDQLVTPPTLIPDYLTRCVHNLPFCASFFSRLNPRFQLLRHNRSSSRALSQRR